MKINVHLALLNLEKLVDIWDPLDAVAEDEHWDKKKGRQVKDKEEKWLVYLMWSFLALDKVNR